MTGQIIPNILITTFLEMTSRDQFRPALSSAPGLTLMQMEPPDVEFYRFLYRVVGEAWRWRDRLLLSDESLRAILDQVDVYVLYESGVPAGYVELDRRGGDVGQSGRA